MSSQAATAALHLARFAPPYERLTPQPLTPLAGLAEWRGCALVWQLSDAATQWEEYNWLAQRPAGLPLMILLPHPDDIEGTVPLLRRSRELRPRAVVPGAVLGTPEHLRALLAAPPRSVAGTVTDYLRLRGVLASEPARREVQRVLELSVHNGGVTIPPEKLAQLFRPFTRTLEDAPGPGLGLGLYIAAEIAKAHRGTLVATSTEAEGTRFVFTMQA